MNKKSKSSSKKKSNLLSEGTYGCVYYPALECKRKVPSNVINKTRESKRMFSRPLVSKLSDENKNETRIVKILKDIDPEQRRFVYHIYSCIPKDSLSRLQCDSIDLYDQKYRLYLMPFAGKSIKEIFSKMKRLGTPIREQIRFLKEYLVRTLENVRVLHKNNILHMDLHEDNILISEDNNKLRLIDFGISVILKHRGISRTNERSDFMFSPPSGSGIVQFPPFLNVMLKVSKRDVISGFRNDGYGRLYPDFKDHIDYMFKMKDRFGNEEYYKKVVLRNVKKVDSFTVGRTFLKLFDSIVSNSGMPRSREAAELKHILKQMVNPNVFEQLSVWEALNKLKY